MFGEAEKGRKSSEKGDRVTSDETDGHEQIFHHQGSLRLPTRVVSQFGNQKAFFVVP
jgi:hypothetical protein